ncbi:hypothetical protein D3C80_1413880 [compost metagenome]
MFNKIRLLIRSYEHFNRSHRYIILGTCLQIKLGGLINFANACVIDDYGLLQIQRYMYRHAWYLIRLYYSWCRKFCTRAHLIHFNAAVNRILIQKRLVFPRLVTCRTISISSSRIVVCRRNLSLRICLDD